MVDIVASARSRSTAAKSLVETAVRAWKRKYPTSKVDDCAVVCLFLDSHTKNLPSASSAKEKEQPSLKAQGVQAGVVEEGPDSLISFDRCGTVRTEEGILEDTEKEEEDAKEDDWLAEDWSALEGVTRVNTLLNLPRFEPGKR